MSSPKSGDTPNVPEVPSRLAALLVADPEAKEHYEYLLKMLKEKDAEIERIRFVNVCILVYERLRCSRDPCGAPGRFVAF